MITQHRANKLETLAKLLAKTWFYCDWKWETPNERVMEMLMRELGYYPFTNEDEMIQHTKVDDELYKQAPQRIYGEHQIQMLEISNEEIFTQAKKEMEEWYGSDATIETDSYFRGACWYREQLKKLGSQNS